jgi:lactoylglutathione lyase
MPMNNATAKFNPDLWVWGTHDKKPRFLHTMIRVKDFDAEFRFYVEGLGMKPLGDRFDVEVRRVTGIFIGFDDYAAGGCVELVQNWDADRPYSHGTGYGHISIGVPDVPAMVTKLETMGAEVTLRPTVLIEGGPHVAFVKDPEGYSVELIQTRRN